MNRIIALLLCFQATVAFGGVTAPSDSPRTLLQAIATAVKNNPKTVAIDELLESIHYSTLASQQYRIPRGNIYCSMNRDYQSGSYNGLPLPSSTSTSGSCGIGASVTLYDGGAGRYRAQSAEASENAAAASYNTSDSHIPNTRGGLASRTQEIFSNISRIRSNLEFYTKYLSVLNEFRTFKNDDNLVAFISDIEQNLTQIENNRELAVSNFHYVVTVDPSPDLDGFEEAIQSLTIPADVEEAVQIATTRGPEVIRRNLNVQMAEFNLKAERASYGPLVTLHGSINGGQYRIMSDSSSSRSSYISKGVGVTLSIPLDPSKSNRLKSAELGVKSQRSEREAALKDAEYEIRTTYRSIANNHRLYVSFKKSLEDQWNFVNGNVEKIRAHDTANLKMNELLTSVNILNQRHHQLLELQAGILQDFFTIQQVTGLLFDNIGSQPEIKTSF